MTDDTDRDSNTDALLGRVMMGGKYRIDALLGVGGWGRVYRGMHLDLGEPVAIKFMRRDLGRDPGFGARFKREAVALARLRHPAIVSILDYGQDDDETFMVMEYIRGRVLSSLVLEGGCPLPCGRVVTIIEQVLQVLEAAHGARIVHRDIKPENVMVLDAGDRVDRIKVLDFGLALINEAPHADRLTIGHTVHGTPCYMSPEQCRGEDAGPPSDIYATGVMLYELLAGAPPFSGEVLTDIMVRHVYVEPPPISQRGVRRPVPPGLEALALWALAKKPEARPTAIQFRDALARASEGLDATTQALRASDQRLSAASLGREERALPDNTSGARTVPMSPAPLRGDGEGPRVVLWGLGEAEGQALRDALAVHGVIALLHDGEELPPPVAQQRTVQAIMLPGDERAAARVRALRSSTDLSRTPIMAVDTPGPALTPALIRAGVSDVVLRKVPADVVCRRLWRLIQRGR